MTIDADRLRSTDASASERGGQGALESATMPCANGRESGWRVEIEVVDEVGAPLAGVAIEIVRADGAGLRTRSGADGRARFEGIEDDGLELGLFELDQAAWALESSSPLGEPRGGVRARFAVLRAPPSRPITHTVVAGDCVSSLAAKHGLLPETIWDHAENRPLRDDDRDPNILAPGDRVHIPERTPSRVSVARGKRHRVVRKGVPERFQVRFLVDGEPRAGVPYLFDVETAKKAPIATREGTTKHDGFLVEPIPPDATRAFVRLDPGANERRYRFDLGHIDPLTTVSGVQARLANLHFYGGPIDGVANEETEAAIRAFQIEHGLEETGQPDQAFRGALERAYGS